MTAKKKKKKGLAEETAGAGELPDPNGNWEPEHLFGQEKTNVESLDVASSLQKQLDAARTQLARLTAEFGNFRKRSQEEREKTLLYANESLVMALLPIFDDFDRATAHMDQMDQDPVEVFEGIKLIMRRIEKNLEQKGVKRFEAIGERFDPYLHEAVHMKEQVGVPPGTVVEEFQAGYVYHDKLLRAAQVIVTPLTPKEEKPPLAEPVVVKDEPDPEPVVVKAEPDPEPELPADEPVEELVTHVEDELTSEEGFQVDEEEGEQGEVHGDFEGSATVVEQMPDLGDSDLSNALDEALDQAVGALVATKEDGRNESGTGDDDWDISDVDLESELEAALNGEDGPADK